MARSLGLWNVICPFDPFRGQVESPGEHDCRWETEDEEDYYKPYDPHRDFEERKHLGRNLDEQPAHDRISGSNPVNLAAFQLGEKLFRVHLLLMPSLSSDGKWARVKQLLRLCEHRSPFADAAARRPYQ